MHLRKAVSLHLGDLPQPVITRYELGTFVYHLYLTRKYNGQPLRLTKTTPESQNLYNLINDLLDQGILSQHRDFPEKAVFRILGRHDIAVEDIACTVDPFAFLSHLSAMDYHGLTDRLPRPLYLSSPVDSKWKELALKRMQKDCGDFLEEYLHSGFPVLRRTRLNRIAQRPVERHGVSDYQGAYRTVRGRVFRVATIGRTFLDMLRQPTLCGGMIHVLNVFELHGQQYLNLIIDEIEQHGQPIDKVRAGYILEERNGIKHSALAKWREYVQRGGSRKLDAKAEYSPDYSERWCLSINVIGA
jgi:predicted transcriptional regulator of viral defense system